jgi:hypothetical protein
MIVNNELGRLWKEASESNLRHYPGICLEGLRKTTKKPQEIYCFGRGSNHTSLEYGSAGFLLRATFSAKKMKEERTIDRKRKSKYST